MIFLTFLFSQSSYTKDVISAETGLAYYSSDEMKEYKITPSGNSQSFSFGIIDKT